MIEIDLTQLSDEELTAYQITLMQSTEERMAWAAEVVSSKIFQDQQQYYDRLSEIRQEYVGKVEALRAEIQARQHPRCIARAHNSWELPKETV